MHTIIFIILLISFMARGEIYPGKNFTNQLFRELSVEGDNVFFSPLTVHLVLSMAYQGIFGTTAQQIQILTGDKTQVLMDYYKLLPSLKSIEGVNLSLAGKIYVGNEYKANTAFEEIVRECFYSQVESVRFIDKEHAASAFNNWIEKKTNHTIRDFILQQDFDGNLDILLLNFIYFKGSWLHPFDRFSTRKIKFYSSEKENYKIDMMFAKNYFFYGINEELDSQVIELKYLDENLSMFVVLPNGNRIDELEEKLFDYDLSKISEGLSYRSVTVVMPKFKIETTINLSNHLYDVGMNLIFFHSYDFNGIVDTLQQISVSDVIQKAFIEVDEGGTRVFGDFKYDVPIAAPIQPPVEFIANRPFFYVIQFKYESKKVILFIGSLKSI